MKLVLVLFAYLLGSLPWSVWIGRIFYGVDIRDYGSGNAGATNTMRVLGTKPGLAVLILDALKGFAAVKLAFLFPAYAGDIELMVVLGVCAVIGHIFPVFGNFKGGKGIATLLGMIIAIHSGAALMAIATFIIFFLSFRIVSLSSILAALSFPVWLIFRYHEHSKILVLFAFAMVFLVLITHQKNIERLLNGKERKISLRKNDD
ncbi:MAG TPA: acyl-phosphate glycerol 3-phosphate acyltransferase [Cryomorphaceae bacterium]|nr:acyl-phosphate glycerol 3-phosphate acyltransferase [Owenweeksia sp.]MBF97491.1 acyl-phosphate glycerol 3-phosphate acyltransferase [Owenweeksia sp.]HAD95916.1 acyl-phosphate glycerol 3-phosphate acyltransferase [Cryomorphaceae bacterium]HBF19993.1 acyl-phosphate glycerol 3-phosphate acyltransferase [Cryomorphaceae bacterium]|tara:strand:+ start:1601 stop:2212 length:612 start_codon:yes stop_codon:yes gene_type:complete